MYSTREISKEKNQHIQAVINLINRHPEIQIEKYMYRIGGRWIITEAGRKLLNNWIDGRRKKT